MTHASAVSDRALEEGADGGTATDDAADDDENTELEEVVWARADQAVADIKTKKAGLEAQLRAIEAEEARAVAVVRALEQDGEKKLVLKCALAIEATKEVTRELSVRDPLCC